VLQREGYTYGWGYRTHGEARLGFEALELRGEVAYGHFATIEGRDRSQERVVHDQHVVERALDYGVSAWVTGLPVPLELQFGLVYQGRLRTSRMPGVEDRVHGRRLLLETALRL
jgi:hypothetical protein